MPERETYGAGSDVRQTGVNATSSADLLDSITVLPYLRERGLLRDDRACRARELTGGVSRIVIEVQGPAAAGS